MSVMNFQALPFAMAILVGGLTFAQAAQRHSIPAMAGTDVSAAFDGGTCAAKVAFVDGGCVLQLRRITEPDPAGRPRTLNVTSEPTPVACGQTVTIVKCPFTCGCPAPAKPAPKKR